MSSSTLLLRLLLCWLLCTHRPPKRHPTNRTQRAVPIGRLSCHSEAERRRCVGGWIFQIPAFHKAHSIYNDRDIARDTSRHKPTSKQKFKKQLQVCKETLISYGRQAGRRRSLAAAAEPRGPRVGSSGWDAPAPGHPPPTENYHPFLTTRERHSKQRREEDSRTVASPPASGTTGSPKAVGSAEV